ncbi:uncharacterized protein TNCV_4374761 [Trichonephila clavipes]|uniref:Tc1-like transposase DDE domain-containing protein n=1 Tax=Trichonephila clavipes TaxID=2585209 RepID=A0A8X7BCG2_TRICX|nr:uncharacterized protein TNCV_4374761 [Trichonephila clavipes]
MPGKRARRHFSQLSEFERGLIIGMKTAGWSMRRIAGQADRSDCAVRNCLEQWVREGTHVRKTGSGATRKTTRREDQLIVRQALVDPQTFPKWSPGAIFHQDNARLHTAKVAQDFVRHFQTLPWPARSPNLSPVEHVWDQLKRQMPSCHAVHDLEFYVQD